MYHGSHHIRGKRSKKHHAIAILIILVPILVLLFAGALTNVPWNILGTSLALSLSRLVVAYFISLVLGAGLALIVGASSFGENLLPVFDVLQNVPSFALIPIFTALMGFSSAMIVAFAATSIIWPIMFYAASAIRGAKQELSDAATIFGATGSKRIFYYLLPLSFPSLVTGSIVGISIGWEAVIGAEIIGNVTGIGTFLNTAGVNNSRLLTVGLLALLVVVFLISRMVWMPLLKEARHYSE
jgi:ABC-type nitrate/sulfonate/bicarbonate transport system permease component